MYCKIMVGRIFRSTMIFYGYVLSAWGGEDTLKFFFDVVLVSLS